MKRLLWPALLFLAFALPARADHIGVYSDAIGASNYTQCGFTSSVAVIHKYSIGATGSRFKLTPPAGSVMYGFVSPFTTVGNITSDIGISYGDCLTGSTVLGTIVAVLTPGTLGVAPAIGQPVVIYTDCIFAERVATGGIADVIGNCPVATENVTWGRIKALYRN